MQHERRHFAEHAAEFLRARALVTQDREVVLHQGVRDDRDAFHR